MSRKYFGKVRRDRICPACKGPLYNPKNPSLPLCEMCETKMCSVCGKISVNGFRISNEGFSFCPKHWNSFTRWQRGRANLDWESDRNFLDWIQNRAKHIETKLSSRIPDINSIEAELNKAMEGQDDSATVEARISAIDKISESIIQGRVIPGNEDENE